jgi:hypothetical protein
MSDHDARLTDEQIAELAAALTWLGNRSLSGRHQSERRHCCAILDHLERLSAELQQRRAAGEPVEGRPTKRAMEPKETP